AGALTALAPGEPTAQSENPQGQEPEHANRDVGAVDPREHEEGGAEQVLPEGQPLMREVRELVRLEAEKDEAEGRRPEEPPARLSAIAALDGGERQHHEQARHPKNGGGGR